MIKKAIIISTFIMVLVLCGSATAATVDDTIDDVSTSTQTIETERIVNIDGTVLTCDEGEPFPGVNVTATDGNQSISTTTDESGNYSLELKTLADTLLVTASYPGHIPTGEILNISGEGSEVSRIVNFTLGVTEDIGPVPVEDSEVATFISLGNYRTIYIHYYGGNRIAGVLNMSYLGETYPSFCIDLFTPISIGDTLLVNGGLSDDILEDVEWCKVNYIIHNYSPTDNNEAAAIQAAIWYFTTAPYGPYPGTNPPEYQFMTYTNGTDDGDPVRARALEIIAAADAAGCVPYPLSITLTPESATLPNGESLELTATVFDQNGDPLPGIDVVLETDKGVLSATSGVTDINGQVKVTLTTDGLFDTTATILAWIEGQYGTLLYDPNEEKQSLTTTTLIPHSIEDVSTVNFISSADLAITKEVSDPRPTINDTIFYTIIVQNRGPNTAVNVRVIDILPEGLTYVSSVANYGTYNPNTGIWTIGNLPADTIAELIITSTVARTGEITNEARVISDTYDPIIDDTTASTTIFVEEKPGPTPVNGKTVPMKRTGLPMGLFVLAILMVFGGVLKAKN
ncbi:MAG: Ig-like domain-containing protein [Methanomicrobiales archaeon]